MIALISAAVVFIADQVTKAIIAGNAAFYDITVIPGFFHITYVKNTGMAWSLLSGYQPLLSIVAAAAIGIMIWYLLVKKPDKLTVLALGFMIGGAAGNLADRLFMGYVRDFLDFYIFGYDFPVFNLADSALCVGVAFLFLAMIIAERKEAKAS